jgi:hypothetical protein
MFVHVWAIWLNRNEVVFRNLNANSFVQVTPLGREVSYKREVLPAGSSVHHEDFL